ncbi:MAG: restriction endonuclease, partial [Dehalococcoidia bacterium]
MSRLELDSLDGTDFEEFCFELLHELGFVNVDWRKGTGLDSSPADGGRDIVAQWERTDVDGSQHLETWFVECKHQK